MQFFTSPEDLRGWVKSRPTPDDAATKIIDMFKNEQNQGQEDIVETCREIYKEDEDGNASKVLFGVLAKHNITQIKGANNMNKEAQLFTIKERICENCKKTMGEMSGKDFDNVGRLCGACRETKKNQASSSKVIKEAQAVQSRQRNNWVRGNRNKWNRVVDGFNEGTPWRIDRDKMYDFTHYYTDDIKFDEDPTHVYSGEALWRMYIMDKFTGDYQDAKGRVVGGYINDRFHRFPTAGTPANPDVDRLQGNQMELAPGERTRKPRPHQYSTERRLEEARGNKLEDLNAVVANSKAVVKIASTKPQDIENDKIFNIFKDVVEMREAGIEYPVMLEAVSKHYEAGIMGVAQIDKIAQDLKKKHEGFLYVKEADTSTPIDQESLLITDPNGGLTMDGKIIPTGSLLAKDIASTDIYDVKDASGNSMGKVRIPVINFETQPVPGQDIQAAADETGLLENTQPTETNFAVEEAVPETPQSI